VALQVGLAGVGAQHIESLAAVVQAVLKGEATCQTMDSEGEGEEEDEESDAEEELLTAVCEVMPALASALGPAAYSPMWAQHFEALARHFRGGRPEALRAVAVGAVAEVADSMHGEMEPYVGRVMPQLLKELKSSESGNRRNAAFCAGMLCLHGGQTGARYFMEVLRHLHPLFAEEEDSGTRDNAAGALARILTAAGPAVPLDQALPVLLGALPLEEDFSEGVPVYTYLTALLSGEHANSVLPFLPGIISAFGMAALDEDTPVEVKPLIGRTVAALHSSYTDTIKPLVDALPGEQQQALAAAAAAAQ